MVRRGAGVAVASGVAALLLAACGSSSPSGPDPANAKVAAKGPASSPPRSEPQRPPSADVVTPESSRPPSAADSQPERTQTLVPKAVASNGRPLRARLSIPAIRLRGLPVVPYRGWTDDAPGTEIQNRGVAASPHGRRGGVGPGGVGNYQVTAHRTSSSKAFANLPSLRRGDHIVVDAGGVRFVYEIRRTRETSFRSPRSLAEQRAAVPGRPDAAPVKAFITLSTCATPEDHAKGNYWADKFDNPEHRIDKIGVLVRTTGASSHPR